MNGKVGLIVLIILNVTHGAGELEVICSPLTEVAVVGDNVTLQCHLNFPLNVTSLTVEWSRGSMKSVVHSCRNGKDYLDDQMDEFKGRTSVCHGQLSRGNLSLKLSNVNRSDAGEYKCFVPKLECQDNMSNVTLIVVPKVTEDKSNRTEEQDESKEAVESQVICSSQPIKAAVGDDVILLCHLETQCNVKELTVEWKVNNSFVHVYRNEKDGADTQDDRFKKRTSLFHEEMIKGNISLTLSSVNHSDTGTYRCSVRGLPGQAKKCYVTLNVVPKVTEDKSNRTEEQDESKEAGGKNKVTGMHNQPVIVIVIVVVPAVVLAVIIVARVLASMRPGTTQSARQEATSGNEEDDSLERENLTPRATPAASNLIRRQTSSE